MCCGALRSTDNISHHSLVVQVDTSGASSLFNLDSIQQTERKASAPEELPKNSYKSVEKTIVSSAPAAEERVHNEDKSTTDLERVPAGEETQSEGLSGAEVAVTAPNLADSSTSSTPANVSSKAGESDDHENGWNEDEHDLDLQSSADDIDDASDQELVDEAKADNQQYEAEKGDLVSVANDTTEPNALLFDSQHSQVPPAVSQPVVEDKHDVPPPLGGESSLSSTNDSPPIHQSLSAVEPPASFEASAAVTNHNNTSAEATLASNPAESTSNAGSPDVFGSLLSAVVPSLVSSGVAGPSSNQPPTEEATSSLIQELPESGTGASEDHESMRADSTRALAPEIVTAEDGGAISDAVLEQFTRQLERLEANHNAEREQTILEHTKKLETLRQSMQNELDTQKKRWNEEHQTIVNAKDDQIKDLLRKSEGMRLRIDTLKREVEGYTKLLEAKDTDIGKVNTQHATRLHELENTVREMERTAWKAKKEEQKVKLAMESAEQSLAELRSEHSTLKDRSKQVAMELKDRRSECRDLQTRLDESIEANEVLQKRADELESHIQFQGRSQTDKDEEMEQVQAQLREALSLVQKLREEAAKKGEEGDKALGEYKKKATNALAMANSRTNAAVQAKEEAELEARAARSTADSAMERAVKADIACREAVAQSNAHVKAMKDEKDEAERQLEEQKVALSSVQTALARAENDLSQSNSTVERITTELNQSVANLLLEQRKASDLDAHLKMTRERVAALEADSVDLRQKLQAAEATAASTSTVPRPTVTLKDVDNLSSNETQKSDSSTIILLQQELRNANETIDDLREALKAAVISSSDKGTPEEATESSGSMPLFYAMEKQAELNTARNEINRLANLLGSAQSEKMEAIERMNDMNHRVEDAEARLRRFEKLSPMQESSFDTNGETAPKHSGSINIEYLKHVMLRFLNSKTASERKGLIPVIGAVLELTEAEQQRAVAAVEEGASLKGVGTTVTESLTGWLSSSSRK
jgi:GRIP domain